MAKPTSLPGQAWDNAATQAQSHLPTEIPPPPPEVTPEVSLPDAADNMSLIGVAHAHLPDWFA
jgi:hypothetical protein